MCSTRICIAFRFAYVYPTSATGHDTTIAHALFVCTITPCRYKGGSLPFFRSMPPSHLLAFLPAFIVEVTFGPRHTTNNISMVQISCLQMLKPLVWCTLKGFLEEFYQACGKLESAHRIELIPLCAGAVILKFPMRASKLKHKDKNH